MFVLAIDTSSAAVSAAVGPIEDPHALVIRTQVNARGHGELLAPTIADCLRSAGVTPAELHAVVAGVGPGPFTGLRVGLVTAISIADARGLPTYGVCSLDALAVADRRVLVATDARRREVYWARYADGRRRDEPSVSRAEDVPLEGCEAMVGAGARQYAEVLGLPLLDGDYPDLRRLVAAAAERVLAGAPSEPLTPLYLRRPDAVAPGQPKAVTP
ncbi:MAG: tRNA (adenosine(37)-N6)-threonylcarbamoyltransferase complex dimerization subunit type 1 TsaB [Actinobacteria bacterium]|nr:tRNA (adenosine(37)-N6)-threonylcarbamoyltransferase complex dimerization subunit type 1 TsaB [Actinomycetota bacterium]